jgi:hypothetical protein
MHAPDTPAGLLVRYDAACRAIAECKAVDDVKDIKDKAEAIRAYAHQVKNPQLEADAWAIRKRAERRLGELSLALDKSKGGNNPGATLPINGKSKSDALADAGISTSSAYRYEQQTKLPEGEWEALIAKGQEAIIAGKSQADAAINAAVKAKTARKPRLDDDGRAIAAEQEQRRHAAQARQDAFYTHIAGVINAYRGAHLDLEFADVIAVFQRIVSVSKKSKGKVLTLPIEDAD